MLRESKWYPGHPSATGSGPLSGAGPGDQFDVHISYPVTDRALPFRLQLELMFSPDLSFLTFVPICKPPGSCVSPQVQSSPLQYLGNRLAIQNGAAFSTCEAVRRRRSETPRPQILLQAGADQSVLISEQNVAYYHQPLTAFCSCSHPRKSHGIRAPVSCACFRQDFGGSSGQRSFGTPPCMKPLCLVHSACRI